MTRAPSHLQLIEQADQPEADGVATSQTWSMIVAGPDDGRLAHPATRRRGRPVPSLHEARGRLIGFVADLLEAPETTGGLVVAGVDEAALAVLRGARDARPHAGRASVVLPGSVHPAYVRAAATVGLVPVVVPVDHDGRAPLGAVAAAIRDDTVLVVASAPSYTHGTVDPIGWIAAATTAKGVPLHVDATCGGWSLAYAERSGRVGPSWGFAVGGVDSVALGVGPESGAGADLVVVLHRDPAAARLAAGGVTTRGPLELPATWTRPGALLADVVETLEEIGHDGCAELAADALDAAEVVADALDAMRGVRLAAWPDSTVVTLRADTTCDVLTIADELHDRGWTSHPVLPESGPALLRLPMTAATLVAVADLLDALDEAVRAARLRGRAQVDATLERLLVRLDPDHVRDDAVHLLLDTAERLDRAAGPGRRSATNLLIAAAAPGVREALLAVHHQRLVRPVAPGPRLAQVPDATNDSTDSHE